MELKPKLIIKVVFRCAPISTQCRGLPVGSTRFVHECPTTGATHRPGRVLPQRIGTLVGYSGGKSLIRFSGTRNVGSMTSLRTGWLAYIKKTYSADAVQHGPGLGQGESVLEEDSDE